MQSNFSKIRHALDVVFFRANSMMAAEATKTYLNFLWWFLDPLINMVIFYVVFALILTRGVENYPFFLIVGLVSWQWFGNTVSAASNAVLQGRHLIGQIKFPAIILPSTIMLVNCYKFAMVFCVLLVVLTIAGFTASLTWLWLIPIVLIQGALIFGLSLIVACIIPVVPDLQYVVTNSIRAMMFLSAIFYPVSAIPEKYQDIFLLNPMVTIIESFRSIMLYNQTPDLAQLSVVAIVAFIVLLIGVFLMRALDPYFSRILAMK